MGSFYGSCGAGVVGRGAYLQNLVLGAAVVAPAQVDGCRVSGGRNGGGQLPGGGGFGAKLRFDFICKIIEVPRTLEVSPRQKVPGTAAVYGGIAVGGKVQAQGVQCRGTAGFKGLPIPGHQAAALLVLDHQRFGGVLPGQVGLGEAGVSEDLHIRADGQIVQCADGVGGGAVLPILAVQQGDGFVAAQAQGAGEGVDEHLVAQAPGKFGVDHARAPSLSYSSSMRRAAVFSS